MEIVISNELYIFLSTVLAGACIGMLYDLFRVIRQYAPGKGLFTDIQDIVFWLTATGIVFFAVFSTNDGRLRSYELIGVVLGLVFYFFVFSRLFMRVVIWLLGLIVKIFLICFKIVLTPFLFLYNIISKPIIYIGRKLKKIFKKLHKRFCCLLVSGRRQIRIKRTKK